MKFGYGYLPLVACFLGLCQLGAVSAEILPVEAYASHPAMSRPDLSPDGNKLALVKNHGGELLIVVYDLNSKTNKAILKADNKEVFLNWYTWANDSILLVSASDVKRTNTVRYTITRLYSVDVTGEIKLKPAVVPRTGDRIPQFQDTIISLLPGDESRILMELDLETANKPGVYEVNPLSGRYYRKVAPKAGVQNWIADRQGKVRMGFGLDGDKAFYRFYDEQADSWKPFVEYELFSEDAINIQGFDKDPDIVYFTALHEGRDALFAMSLSDPDKKRTLIYADPIYDVDGSLIYSDKTGEVVGFSHNNAQDSVVYWDEDMLKLQRSLAAALPDSYNAVLDTSDDGNRYLVFHSSDTEPGIYLLGDRKAKSLNFIGARYEAINETNYAGKAKVVFKARDGLEIEGYLTRPKVYKEGEKLPTIILPHGGPHARDFGGFDYWSELFANRGYLVLQPNFRGSSGYGYEFEMSALQNWGGAMQDDLQDAANYLVEQGLADPKRICIGGGSYGGYAALMAVVKHPDTFKCAASFAGVTDLEELVAKKRRYFTNKGVVEAQFGKDEDKLEEASPINYAKAFSRPVLLVHGTDDATVFVAHSRDMASALKDAGKDVTYIELENGDHHLRHQPHRMTTLNAFLDFFDKHLKNN